MLIYMYKCGWPDIDDKDQVSKSKVILAFHLYISHRLSFIPGSYVSKRCQTSSPVVSAKRFDGFCMTIAKGRINK